MRSRDDEEIGTGLAVNTAVSKSPFVQKKVWLEQSLLAFSLEIADQGAWAKA